MEKQEIKAYILKKAYEKYVDEILEITPQELRDRVEDCVLAYGSVFVKDGRVLTLEEMESLFIEVK